MCLKWWLHDRSKIRAPSPCTDVEDEKLASGSKVSGFFSSKVLSSVSSNSSSSSFAGSLIRDLLPQRPLFYRRSEIAAATHNFDAAQQIGSFAWKGVLHGSAVAIVQKPGVVEDFNKLLRRVHALHHSSLVKVVGGCAAADSVFVVYELVHGDNLQSCLFSTLAPGFTVLSTWRSRMQVAVDVAKGLDYIHQHTSSQSAHKYLTSSNVMLTKEALRAKLVLVGMSVLTGEANAREAENDSHHDEGAGAHESQKVDASRRKRGLESSGSIKIKGTHGYIPPEYVLSGVVSQKYDVFTFGIVLLELLKGGGLGREQRLKSRRVSIVEEARSIFPDEKGDRGSLRLWIDRRLNDSYPVDDAMKLLRLVLLCVDENPDRRPTMRDVALRMALFLDSAETWDKQRSTFTETTTLEGR
ncbi:hypothetical protein L7F22_012384 [Adiantum nelumboides]|nr:hypothetical protein [Adiantum nelumboides]